MPDAAPGMRCIDARASDFCCAFADRFVTVRVSFCFHFRGIIGAFGVRLIQGCLALSGFKVFGAGRIDQEIPVALSSFDERLLDAVHDHPGPAVA